MIKSLTTKNKKREYLRSHALKNIETVEITTP